MRELEIADHTVRHVNTGDGTVSFPKGSSHVCTTEPLGLFPTCFTEPIRQSSAATAAVCPARPPEFTNLCTPAGAGRPRCSTPSSAAMEVRRWNVNKAVPGVSLDSHLAKCEKCDCELERSRLCWRCEGAYRQKTRRDGERGSLMYSCTFHLPY